MSILLVVLPFFAFLLAMVIRRLAVRNGWILPERKSRYAGAFLPASAPSASGVSRIVEATALALAAVIILASWHTLSGNMASQEHRMANDIAFACVVAAVGIAVLAALLGRTGVGAGVMIAAILVYSMFQIGSRPIQMARSSLLSPNVDTDVKYTIDLDGTNVKGADLWVNGVYLGKTPYTTTLSDFRAKVPYWPDPPADYETEKVESKYYWPRASVPEIRHHWISFSRPACVSLSQNGALLRAPIYSAHQRLGLGEAPTKTPDSSDRWDQTSYYFAKVCYAGEWGLAGTGSGSGSSQEQMNSHFDVIFRQRQKRLDTLLNMARAAKYRVGPEWFEAAETYNGDAWIALGKAAENEPPMSEVRDAWATWRYGLNKVNNAESAWAAFEQICDEADSQQQYLTDSVAGRAVELLVPKLPQERLMDKAVQLIRDRTLCEYLRWEIGGRLQFGCRQRPGTLCVGASSVTGYVVSSGDKTRLPTGGFPVVHAVWMLDEQSRSTDQSQPNIIQQRIATELVRWHYKDFDTLPMMLASYIGGSAVDKFLLRHNWQTAPASFDYVNSTQVSGQDVNRWLYLLAYLNDDAGHKFRQTHTYLFMELADRVYQHSMVVWQGNLDFIFIDPWLAKKYWPRFAPLARQKSAIGPLQTQWEYLFRMGEAATVDMFVEAWKDTHLSQSDYWGAPSVLDKLNPPMRRAVINAIVRQVREDDGNLADVWNSVSGRNPSEKRDSVVSMLESHDQTAPRLSEADHLYADLQKEPGTGQESLRQSVPLWLAHTQPDSPLVAMLAKADQPELRLMVMDALAEYPTPQNQELLEKLLKDSDPAVRTAAEKASQQIKKLAAQEPADYASDPTSAAR